MLKCILRMLAVILLHAAGVLLPTSVAHGQVEARQTFVVRVPPKLSVTAPTSTVSTSYDGTSDSQAFTAQRWQVEANSRFGATVSFSTEQAFTHAERGEVKRDALLDLAMPGPETAAHWTIAVASDRTSYQGAVSDEQATVRAVSDRPGEAAFDITVTFLADPVDALEPGEYSLTVVGTLTAN
jgi:hypothetical protein